MKREIRLPEKDFAVTYALRAFIEQKFAKGSDATVEELEVFIWDLKAKVEEKYEHFLKWFRTPSERARAYHTAVDAAVAKERRVVDESKPFKIQCTVGCDACCHLVVQPTDDEMELLADRVMENVPIDMKKLETQASYPADAKFWWKLSRREGACVFLGEDKLCRVYKDRPLACRVHFAVSPASWCGDRGKNGEGRQTENVFMRDAQILASAAVQGDTTPGTLPEKLWKILKRRGATHEKVERSIQEAVGETVSRSGTAG